MPVSDLVYLYFGDNIWGRI